MRLPAALLVTLLCATGIAHAEAPKFAATKNSLFHRRQISVDVGDGSGLQRTRGRVHDKSVTAWKAGDQVVASVRKASTFPENIGAPVEAAIDRHNRWSARVVQEGKRTVWVQTGSPTGFAEQTFRGGDALERAIAHANQHLDTADHAGK
jgi:hypothetical protein